MNSHIRTIRTQQGITLSALGARLGVTAGAVSQYEASEAAGTIQVSTLTRVLGAMGALYLPTVTMGAVPSEKRREVQLNLAMHRAIAKKLLDDPTELTARALTNLPKIRANVVGPRPESLVDEWESLLRGPVGPLLSALLDESSHGIDLRQNSPFAGALTQDERLAIVAGPR